MGAVYILWLRELKRYVRSRAQIVASLGQPLLYLLALGFGLGPVFQKSGNGSYLQFLAPGVIGMSVLFTSIFSGIGFAFSANLAMLLPKASLSSPSFLASPRRRSRAFAIIATTATSHNTNFLIRRLMVHLLLVDASKDQHSAKRERAQVHFFRESRLSLSARLSLPKEACQRR